MCGMDVYFISSPGKIIQAAVILTAACNYETFLSGPDYPLRFLTTAAIMAMTAITAATAIIMPLTMDLIPLSFSMAKG